MNRVVVALLGAGLAGFGRAETVRVGYFSEPQPFVAGIAREWFDTADDDFAFFNQQSGYWVNAKLDQGDLDIAFLGSNPFAVGAARGVAATSFYVQYVIGDSEALVMRRDGVNLQPGEIIGGAAGAIDGAFIWDAGVDAKNHIIDNGGFQMLSSGLYEVWGKPTSMVCRGVCDSADAALWDPASEESLLASIALAHAGVNDAETRLDFKTKMEKNYLFRPPATQLTCDFLGDGSGCDAGFGPTIEAHADAAFYASNVDPTFLLNGLAAAPTLDELVALGKPVAPATAGSANRGDSTCGAATLAGSGTADDGAGGRPGTSYSNGLACSWTISGSGVAQVDFDVLKVWAGDAVSVYGGDAATGVLLARLSGLGAKAWPVFRYPGTITVLFETDGLDGGARQGPRTADVALTGRGAAVVAVPVDGDGLATLSFDSDDFGQRSGFVAEWTVAPARGVRRRLRRGDCVAGTCDCEDGWAGYACSLDFCLPSNPYVAAARGIAYSQPPGVEAVPRNADCAWSAGLADPTNERAGTRLYFDAFDVERFEKTAGGTYDAVTVSRPDGAVVAGPLSLLRCRADYECDEKWMSGACVDDDRAPGFKYCAVKRTWELDTEDDLRIGFASDRNDIGAGGSPPSPG
ncbi:NMT1-like protein [Aureococcus anophagefferens]|nr:NMT1-like protein [Aureococcus anophagefferens]